MIDISSHHFRVSKGLIVSLSFALVSILVMAIVGVSYSKITNLSQYGNSLYARSGNLERQIQTKDQEVASLSAELQRLTADHELLQKQDQKVRNDRLESDIKQIEVVYASAAEIYEKLLELREVSKKTQEYEEQYAQVLAMLSEREYASAQALLTDLGESLTQKKEEVVSSFSIPESVPVNNQAPSSGYRRQQVTTDTGTFMVSVVAADLNSVKVIIDTASEGDCTDNCPVLSLGDYAARNNALAAVNGGYFCPATYPSCNGKTNSFDTLLMNKNKVYFNSENNVYSFVPAVIFSGTGARFVGRSSEWGRDTNVDAVIANQPLLVSSGSVVFGGDDDAKKGSKSPRGFIGTTGSTVYIGVVHNATVAESAKVLATMGIRDALNLDGGGSAALWSGGYKVGPGRNIPNAVLIVPK